MQQTLLDVARTTKRSSTEATTLEHSYTLFQEPWWLDAVAPGEWDEVVIKRGAEVAARLPFLRRTQFGRNWLLQPKLTPYLGPWLRPSSAKLANSLAEQKELMTELIDALPRFDLFRQCFAPEVTYWLPFFWRGFRQTTRYTYRLSHLTDLPTIWAGFRPNIRLEIRKAERTLAIRNDLDIDRFLRVWERTFERQNSKLPVSKEQCYRIENACTKRGCRTIFFAEDAQGKVHAATYLVWNSRCTYYLMAGGDPELRTSGAGSLVMWEAIKFAAKVSQHFDFEGSMIEPVERFFRAFGGTPTPYFSVQKLSPAMRFFYGLYHSTAALIGRNPRL